MPAVVLLSFDPYVQLVGLTVPLRAIGVAAAILLAVAAAAGISRPIPGLRRDDLLYLVIGAVPGAVVGGRLFHALAYADYYARDPGAVLDPARGSLSLLGAVLGGTASAAAVASLVGARPRAWLGAAAVPLLLGIGVGKIAQALGGAGQGLALDAAWAVAFAGPGPWLSAAPSVPSHPSQLYEALWALIGVPPALAIAINAEWRWRHPAGLFAAALGWWLAGRALIGFTWRDERGLGPFTAEQALALLALGLLLVAVAWTGRRAADRAESVPESEPAARVEETWEQPVAPTERLRGRGRRRRKRARRQAGQPNAPG